MKAPICDEGEVRQGYIVVNESNQARESMRRPEWVTGTKTMVDPDTPRCSEWVRSWKPRKIATNEPIPKTKMRSSQLRPDVTEMADPVHPKRNRCRWHD